MASWQVAKPQPIGELGALRLAASQPAIRNWNGTRSSRLWERQRSVVYRVHHASSIFEMQLRSIWEVLKTGEHFFELEIVKHPETFWNILQHGIWKNFGSLFDGYSESGHWQSPRCNSSQSQRIHTDPMRVATICLDRSWQDHAVSRVQQSVFIACFRPPWSVLMVGVLIRWSMLILR